MHVITNIIPSPEAVAAAVSNPGAVVEGVKQQAATVARGAEVLRSDPAKAAAILNDNPRDVGRVLGEAAATAAMAKLDTGGTGCSFDADTPVATLDGQRAIGALQVGDTVLAFNAATGMLEADPITHVWVNHDPAIEQLTLSGETLDTTPEHPFFTSERGWVVAGELLVGEHVRRLDGSWGVVEQLTIEVRPVVMYNLTVARAHTFFVGDEGWLVHNTCGPLRAGEAGKFADLNARAATGDGLTPHHMPQAAAGFTTRGEGGAIMLPTSEHELTRTFKGRGVTTARNEVGLPFRQVLARDIKDLRGIAGSKYNAGIKGLLNYYRTNFPNLIDK